MEAFGLAASIITAVETSWKVIGFLEGVKHGGKSRLALLEEVTLLWLVFRRPKEEIDLTTGKQAHQPWVEPLKVLDGPRGVSAQIREQLSDLEQQLTAPTGRFDEAMSSLRWPFQEKEVTRIVSRLQKLKQTTILVLQQSGHRMSREMLGELSQIKHVVDDTLLKKVLTWLTPLNFVQKQQEVLGSADPYSCPVLGSKRYILWHEDSLRSLWCWGAPGKSVVAASVYADLTKRYAAKNVAVLIGFCSFEYKESQSPRSIIAGFLKQALQTQRDGKVLPKLKEHYSRAVTGADTQPLTLEALTGLLGEELKTCDETYIILDGLDEVSDISERDAMVKAIHNIGGGVKVFITSRHAEGIAEALNAMQTCEECNDSNAEVCWRSTGGASHVVCDQCQSSGVPRGESKRPTTRERKWESTEYRPRESDISTYVMTRIDAERELRRLIGPDSGQDSLRKEIGNQHRDGKVGEDLASGPPSCGSLVDCLTLGALRRALRDLTGDLDQMYTKSLERMDQSLRPKHYEILKKLLLWIAWGQRPLSIGELGHALAIYPGIEDVDEEDILPIRQIAAWSAGLLFVDSDDFLRVIHPTTSRFFESRRHELYPKGDSVIAHDCLHYLNMKALRVPLTGPDRSALFIIRHKQYPLIGYAVLNLLKHVTRSGEKGVIDRTLGFLLSDARKSFIQALHYLNSEWKDETEATALHVSVYFGATDVVSKLVDQGEELDAQDLLGATPLMYAAARGNDGLSELRSLLKAGADPSITCKLGSTALIRAVKLGAEPCGDRTSASTRPPRARHRHRDLVRNETPFFYSARVGLTDFMELLLDHGADINDEDNNSGNALMRAVDCDETGAVELLVKRGIDTGHRDVYGRTALHSSSCNRSWRSMEYLLAHVPDLDVNARGRSGETPLHDSAWKLDARGASLLVDAGARCDIKNSDGQTPVDIVLLRNRPDILEIIKRAKGYVENSPGARLQSSLSDAVIGDPSDVLQARIAKATLQEINASLAFAGTALHEACRHGRADVVGMLLRAGADMSVTNSFGRTPADKAIKYGQLECVKVLFNHDPDPDRGPTSDGPMWEFACKRHHLDIARALVEAANVDKSSDYLQKALDGAAMDDKVAVTRRLVEAGASMKREMEGYPARDRAESRKALEMLEYFSALDID
ncbi:hypothetical protein CMUS01_04966 [Colletotrichum musicola]|uniref:Nephrocystin 3-like N-terminal domain-containing protein n=1 Tax=Colletotrichum musicola TaxID=2175873 RepID=A0A8H6NM67_9PEZI|nr:hypothetical protein CMUS01_04966 [Colletotrichum musicola]